MRLKPFPWPGRDRAEHEVPVGSLSSEVVVQSRIKGVSAILNLEVSHDPSRLGDEEFAEARAAVDDHFRC